jgi:hypothetical protein
MLLLLPAEGEYHPPMAALEVGLPGTPAFLFQQLLVRFAKLP